MVRGSVRGEPPTTQVAESLWHLAYRYVWPFQYFRDVTRGDRLERRQNYRHNRAMRVHLPGFMLKWAMLTVFWFAAGSTMDQLGFIVLAAGCFVTGSWTLIMVVLLGVDWLWLERFPELF